MRYISQGWDFDLLSKRVIAFNLMEEGEEKEAERAELVKITETLIYLLPLERSYLKEEELASFFLEQRANADKLLSAYTISKIPYNEYIAQVLRKRCVTFVLREKAKESDQLRLSAELGEEAIVEKENDQFVMEDKQKYRPVYPLSVDISSLSLAEVIEYIINSPTISSAGKINSKEDMLREKLLDKRKRKQFLTMLLNLPITDCSQFIDHLASVFQTIPELFARFFELKDQIKMTKKEDAENSRAIRNRHYRILLRLEDSYNKTDDENERKCILSAYEKLRRAFEKRNVQIKNAQRGISQRDIAKILDISPALVSINIRAIRKLLEELNQQYLLLDDQYD